MTDYTDLIAWLRTSNNICDHEAATALEAQARRIAELEAALKFYSCQCDLTDIKNQRCGGANDEQFCGYVARMAMEKKDD